MPYADPEKQKEAKRNHARAKYARDKAHRKEKIEAALSAHRASKDDPHYRAMRRARRLLDYYKRKLAKKG